METKRELRAEEFGGGAAVVLMDSGLRAAYCYGAHAELTQKEAMSYARMFSAAPDLYEACAWALKFAETAPSINLERYSGFFPERFFEVLRAAMAKADGREVEG